MLLLFVPRGIEVFVDDFVGERTPSNFMTIGYLLKIDLCLWFLFGLILVEVVIELLHGLILLQQFLIVIQ